MNVFYQWWIFRIPVLFLFLAFSLDYEIFFLLIPFTLSHLSIGLKSVLTDYLHSRKLLILLIVLLRLCNFEFLRYVLEFLF